MADEAKKIEELEKSNADLTAQNAKLQEDVAAKDALIKEQAATIEDMGETIESLTSEKSTSKTEVVISHKKTKYRVTRKAFKLKGVVHKAEELKVNESLVESLLKIKGQNILVKA